MCSIKINQIFPGSFYFRWTRFPIKWEMAAARYSFGLNRRSDVPVTLTKSYPGNARAPREKGDRGAWRERDESKCSWSCTGAWRRYKVTRNTGLFEPKTADSDDGDLSHVFVRQSGGTAEIFDTFGIWLWTGRGINRSREGTFYSLLKVFMPIHMPLTTTGWLVPLWSDRDTDCQAVSTVPMQWSISTDLISNTKCSGDLSSNTEVVNTVPSPLIWSQTHCSGDLSFNTEVASHRPADFSAGWRSLASQRPTIPNV